MAWKQQKSGPNSKVAKADKLRLEANEKGAKMRAVVDQWRKEADSAKDLKKRADVDVKFKRLFNEAEEAEAKAYKKYYDYVQKNFPQEDVGVAVRKGLKTGKGFMGKTFINSLEKLQKGGRK